MRIASTLALATLCLTGCDPTVRINGQDCPAYVNAPNAIECWHAAESPGRVSDPSTTQPSGYITYRAGIIYPDAKLDSMMNPRGPVYITRPLP